VFAARQTSQRGIFAVVLKLNLHHHGWDTASWSIRNSCEKRYSLFLLLISDLKRVESSLSFMIANFHTELKPQVKLAMA